MMLPGFENVIALVKTDNSYLDPVVKNWLKTIDWRLGWWDLASSERTTLRFAWELVHRGECPYPLNRFSRS